MTRYVYRWPFGLSVIGSLWRPTHRVAMARSLLTGAIYQTETARPRIQASITVVSGPGFQPGLLDVFLANLSGGAGLAFLADPARCASGLAQAAYQQGAGEVLWRHDQKQYYWDDAGTQRPWYSPRPITAIAGSPAGTRQISIGGLYPNQPAFARGAEIGVGGWRYVVTDAVTANGDGETTIPIAPRLREAVAIGDAIDHALWGLFALVEDPKNMDRDVAGVMRPTLEFIQVFEDEIGESLTYETA